MLPFEPTLYPHLLFFTLWNADVMSNDSAASVDYGSLRMEASAECGGAERQKDPRFWMTSWSYPTISFGLLLSVFLL